MKEYFDYPKVGKVLLSMICYLEIIKENIDKFGYMNIKNLSSWKTINRKIKKKREKTYMTDKMFNLISNVQRTLTSH